MEVYRNEYYVWKYSENLENTENKDKLTVGIEHERHLDHKTTNNKNYLNTRNTRNSFTIIIK